VRIFVPDSSAALVVRCGKQTVHRMAAALAELVEPPSLRLGGAAGSRKTTRALVAVRIRPTARAAHGWQN